eukprot:788687_1
MASERAERLRERNSNKKKAEEEEKKREPNKPNKSWFKKGHKLNAHPDPAGYESRDKRYRYERYQDNRKRENQGDLAREKRLETWWQHKKQQESIDKAKRARKPKPFHNKECDLTLQSNKRIFEDLNLKYMHNNPDNLHKFARCDNHSNDRCKCKQACIPGSCHNSIGSMECNDNTCIWYNKCRNRRMAHGLCQPVVIRD